MIEIKCSNCGASVLVDPETHTVWHRIPECSWFQMMVLLSDTEEVTDLCIVVDGDGIASVGARVDNKQSN